MAVALNQCFGLETGSLERLVDTSAAERAQFGAVIFRSNAEWSSFQYYWENFGGRNIMWEIKCMKVIKHSHVRNITY